MILLGKYKHFFLSPNALSALRGVIGIGLPFLILRPEPLCHILAFGLFMIGAITDYLDGWMARQYKMESAFGRWVDPFVDKILILAPLAAFAKLHFYSFWWIVPVIAREIIVTFCRTGWLFEGKSIGAEMFGKLKFVFQTITVWVAFAYFILKPYRSLVGLNEFLFQLLPVLLVVSVVLTIISGVFFMLNQRAHFTSEKFAQFTLALGVGLSKRAPGTWGSLLGVLLAFLTRWNFWLYGLTFAFLVIAGARAYRLLKDLDPDPQYIVIDEACGIFVTFMLIPMTWVSVLFGFILFRLFDVWKPFPMRALERIPGYWGIMADDFGAGFYAWILLFLIFV